MQAVASMLLGINPDEMTEEKRLMSWNSDRDKDEKYMWPYPPVMLLEAKHDFEWYADRMNRTVKFFQRQASYCHISVSESKNRQISIVPHAAPHSRGDCFGCRMRTG